MLYHAAAFDKSGYGFYGRFKIVPRGLSTKPEEGRGRGLGNSLKIITEGMKGEVLVVSRRGAVSINRRGVSGYILQGTNIVCDLELKGTLVAARIPFPPEDVNVYAYVD